MSLSIILPVFNESKIIAATLDRLTSLRSTGAEIIVVDGGSTDGTQGIAVRRCDKLLSAPCGRALQMNAGAREASGEELLFLHADTCLPPAAHELIRHALLEHHWGHFEVRIEGKSRLLRIVAMLMNFRSRITAVATGDQCLFLRRSFFEAHGGYKEIPLMEDIELCKRLRQTHQPAVIQSPATTSGRRWERNGVLRTIVLMWQLRLAFSLGADPRTLAKRYSMPPSSQD